MSFDKRNVEENNKKATGSIESSNYAIIHVIKDTNAPIDNEIDTMDNGN
jgi:hypothetical protein